MTTKNRVQKSALCVPGSIQPVKSFFSLTVAFQTLAGVQPGCCLGRVEPKYFFRSKNVINGQRACKLVQLKLIANGCTGAEPPSPIHWMPRGSGSTVHISHDAADLRNLCSPAHMPHTIMKSCAKLAQKKQNSFIAAQKLLKNVS